MSFFDLISELRAKEANPTKAAKAMKVIAVVCLLVGIWNYAVVVISSVSRFPFRVDPGFPAIALATGTFLATLFFLASRGISNKAGWGKRLGQLAVILLIAAIVAGCYVLFSGFMSTFPMPPTPVLIVFSVLFIGQFVVPAFFGILYLGRLPVDENGYVRPSSRPGTAMRTTAASHEHRQSIPVKSYKESPVPFGVIGTFILILAVPMLGIVFAQQYASPAVFAFLFAGMFAALFIGPVLYNRAPSSFELARTVAASYTGGGSLMMFNGSWPFFRLLVYDDGVEVRVMFHRFFIPYDKMEDLPEKIGFFSWGILFKSDLPGVPSRIRFEGFGSKTILGFVRERRSRFLAMNTTTGGGMCQ